MGATSLSYKLKTQALTLEEKYFIQACLLGDGSLLRSGKHYRLRVAHQVAHKEYVWWKYFHLKQLCVSEPSLDRINQSLRFGTVGHPEITDLRELWYRPMKQIPSTFYLNEMSLAVWFMDDGCRTGKTVNFSVHSFTDDDVIFLRKLLSQRNIATAIHSDGKGKRLYILQSSYPLFKNLVKPYIISCMAYKLP